MSQSTEATVQFAVVQPSGVFDGSQAGSFRQAIEDHLATSNVILVDLQEVKFMDSSGLGAIVAALKTVRSAGGQLYLCALNQQVKMLFELTSVDQVFELFPNRAAFVEAIGG